MGLGSSIENSNAKNAVDKDLKILDEIVSGVKTNQKEVERYMVMMRSGEEWYQDGIETGKSQGIEIGKSQGIEIGKNQGVEEERRRMKQLVMHLGEANRMEDLLRATTDDVFREELIREFGIDEAL